MITPNHERRDWTLLIFIIPIGVILMLVAGQFAVRLVPNWSVNAGMQSNLDPNNLPNQQSGPVQPILPAILTPLGWLDTFLTPGADTGDAVVFPPFVVLEPTGTPVATTPPPTVPTTPPPATTPPATSTPVVTTPPPVTTKPPEEPTDPTSTPPMPTEPPAPVPPELGVDTPPDGNPGDILPGTYVVVDVTGSPIVVESSPDGNYDVILYEATYTDPLTGDIVVLMDQISVLISQDDVVYYEIFNWGDNAPDTNTNLDYTTPPPDCAQECDNREVPLTEFYTDNGISTGILIDVDTAPDNPPEGEYYYVMIVSPPGVDSAQVDSVVVEEVPFPSAPVAPVNSAPSVNEIVPVEEPASLQESVEPPAEQESPVEKEPDPPSEEAPEPPPEEPTVSP